MANQPVFFGLGEIQLSAELKVMQMKFQITLEQVTILKQSFTLTLLILYS